MFGIGGAELFIILIFAFLIVGPDKLPEAARTLGKALARFRSAQQDMKDALGGEKIIDLDNPDEPFKDPMEVLDRVAQRQEEKKATNKTSSSPKPSSNKSKNGTADVKQNNDAQSATQVSSTDEAEVPRESFSERKARYERERAAQKSAKSNEEMGGEQ